MRLNDQQRPLHVLKGRNHLRYFLLIIIVLVITFFIYSAITIGYIMILPVLVVLPGILFIKFPYLYVYEGYFTIEERGLFKKYNHSESFKYEDIKEINYIKGHMKWSLLIILSLMGKAAQGGFSKPDRIIFTLKNGEFKFLFRLGSKQDFEYTANMLKNKTLAYH